MVTVLKMVGLGQRLVNAGVIAMMGWLMKRLTSGPMTAPRAIKFGAGAAGARVLISALR